MVGGSWPWDRRYVTLLAPPHGSLATQWHPALSVPLNYITSHLSRFREFPGFGAATLGTGARPLGKANLDPHWRSR
ncbi:hypothetical protein GCM10010277_24320 [Streptomyces longisporoflavus]|nr:hypothetical protein GCM10010277_24320 [Streptomyces longisporoflavus]